MRARVSDNRIASPHGRSLSSQRRAAWSSRKIMSGLGRAVNMRCRAPFGRGHDGERTDRAQRNVGADAGAKRHQVVLVELDAWRPSCRRSCDTARRPPPGLHRDSPRCPSDEARPWRQRSPDASGGRPSIAAACASEYAGKLADGDKPRPSRHQHGLADDGAFLDQLEGLHPVGEVEGAGDGGLELVLGEPAHQLVAALPPPGRGAGRRQRPPWASAAVLPPQPV